MKYHKIINKLKSLFGFNKTIVKAVYDKNLKSFLVSLEILEEIESGQFHCKVCKKIITIDNLEVITIQDGKIKIICSKKTCLKTIH